MDKPWRRAIFIHLGGIHADLDGALESVCVELIRKQFLGLDLLDHELGEERVPKERQGYVSGSSRGTEGDHLPIASDRCQHWEGLDRHSPSRGAWVACTP